MDFSSIIDMLSKLLSQQNNTTNHTDIIQQSSNPTQQVTTSSFPPSYNYEAKQVNNISNMPIYPQSAQIHTTNNNQQSPLSSISNILSNPETIKLISQILPMLNNSSNGNLFSNLFANNSKKNTPQNIEMQNNEEEFDIESYIKIDDS